MPTAADDLKRVPLFASLNNRQLQRLARLFRERIIEAGTSVVQQGKMSGVGFFVVADGEAVVAVDGREVATLGPGDYFGELALVSEGERTATVTARTQVRCLEIPFWDFREFAFANPDVMWKLLQQIVSRLQPSAAAAPATV
jgi:CRP/FNR family transcriptional regulator, cyclic AMP receptor protein